MEFANQVKVTAKLLNCRLQPSMSAQILGTIKMDEVHNVVAEQDGWGQLENGSWINLKFAVPHEHKETTEISENFVTGMSIVGEEQLEVSSMVPTITTTVAKII